MLIGCDTDSQNRRAVGDTQSEPVWIMWNDSDHIKETSALINILSFLDGTTEPKAGSGVPTFMFHISALRSVIQLKYEQGANAGVGLISDR